MAQPMSKTQLPLPAVEAEMFEKGIALGRAAAVRFSRGIAAWAEENPGQVILVGLAAGFFLGKLFLPKRRRIAEVE
jgi:hypothetical protein